MINLILRLVVGQRDVLEELDVQEDGQLVELFHQHTDLVVHRFGCRDKVVLGLLKLANVPDEALMLLILILENHCATCYILVCLLGFLLAQLAQLHAIVIVLLSVYLALLRQINEHGIVHVDVFDLRGEVCQNLAVLLNNLLVGTHVPLDAFVVAGHLASIVIEGLEAFAQLLSRHHRAFILVENVGDVGKLTFHFSHLASDERLPPLNHLIVLRRRVLLLLCHILSDCSN